MAWSDLEWTVGDRIKKACEKAGYRRDHTRLEQETGVPRQTIARWIEGKTTPNQAVLSQVLWVLAPRLGVEAPALARYIATGELPEAEA